MKVVINRCYGGFGLSDEAIEECIKRGMSVREDDQETLGDFTHLKKRCRLSGHKYYINGAYDNQFRSHSIVVAVVEEMGDKADDAFSKLRVINIPFDSCEGWEITEYDGMESVEEIHQSWS